MFVSTFTAIAILMPALAMAKMKASVSEFTINGARVVPATNALSGDEVSMKTEWGPAQIGNNLINVKLVKSGKIIKPPKTVEDVSIDQVNPLEQVFVIEFNFPQGVPAGRYKFCFYDTRDRLSKGCTEEFGVKSGSRDDEQNRNFAVGRAVDAISPVSVHDNIFIMLPVHISSTTSYRGIKFHLNNADIDQLEPVLRDTRSDNVFEQYQFNKLENSVFTLSLTTSALTGINRNVQICIRFINERAKIFCSPPVMRGEKGKTYASKLPLPNVNLGAVPNLIPRRSPAADTGSTTPVARERIRDRAWRMFGRSPTTNAAGTADQGAEQPEAGQDVELSSSGHPLQEVPI